MRHLDATEINVDVDTSSREVIIIPDDVVADLQHHIHAGWRETGWDSGESQRFPADSWTATTTATLLAAYATSPIPAVLVGRDRDDALVRRRWAAESGHCAVLTSCRSAWDPTTRWWTADANSLPWVPGCPHTDDDGSVVYRG